MIDGSPDADERPVHLLPRVADAPAATHPAADGPPPDAPATVGARRAGIASLRVLWLNAAGLLLVLVALLAVMGPEAVAVPDEGVYLAQAHALSDGSWSIPRAATDVDPNGELSRLLPEAILGDTEVPYARHGTYPMLLAPAFWLGDYPGTLVLSMFGLWGAAVSGAFIARRIDPRLGVATLWLIGAGSPLVFYGFVTMAHSLAAAAAGTAFLGITRWLDDRRVSALAYGLPALLATVLLRSEGTVFALAVAATVGLMALGGLRSGPDGTGRAVVGTSTGPGLPGKGSTGSGTPGRHLDPRQIVTSATIGAAVVVTYFLDTKLDEAITGIDGYGVNPASIATRSSADPVSGSWASLFRPFAKSWETVNPWVPISVVALIGASAALRLTPSRTRLPMGLLFVAGAAGAALIVDPPWLVTGLLATFPALAAGLLWLRRSDLSSPLLQRIVVTAVIATAGIVATLYSNGGAAEWGGRFFHLLIPVLTPAAVFGLYRASRRFTATQRHVAVACVVMVTVALSASALRVQTEIRSEAAAAVQGAIDFANGSSDGRPTLVVVANARPGGNSRAFWRPDPAVEVISTIALERLHPTLEAAQREGREQVVVVTDVGADEFLSEVSAQLGELRWRILGSSSERPGDTELFLLGAP